MPYTKITRFIEAAIATPTDDCVMWPFQLHRGYGRITTRGRNIKAHRYICALAYGDPPSSGHEAQHTCEGGKACVNPHHLRWAERRVNDYDSVIAAGLAGGAACVRWPFDGKPMRDGKIGYSRFKERHGAARSHVYVHRVVCEMAHGSAPAGKSQAAHLCGVNRCINAEHLRWSTQEENMTDIVIAKMSMEERAAADDGSDSRLAQRLAVYPGYLRGKTTKNPPKLRKRAPILEIGALSR